MKEQDAANYDGAILPLFYKIKHTEKYLNFEEEKKQGSLAGALSRNGFFPVWDYTNIKGKFRYMWGYRKLDGFALLAIRPHTVAETK